MPLSVWQRACGRSRRNPQSAYLPLYLVIYSLSMCGREHAGGLEAQSANPQSAYLTLFLLYSLASLYVAESMRVLYSTLDPLRVLEHARHASVL